MRLVKNRGRVMFVVTMLVCGLATALVAAPPEKIDFQRDVRSILAEKCIGCHGPNHPEAGVRLVDRASILANGESGQPIVVAGQPDHSELIRRVTSTDPELRMPPGEKPPLTPDQIAILKKWIESGADWSAHWSFVPIPRPPVPDEDAAFADWPRTNLDRFVLRELVARKWTPSPEADRFTLLKRLSYDLIGLPPTIAEADEFVKDTSLDAYEKVVQRRLDSPHFGERWGRHWLDLAHYADSDGYEKDRARADAYLFRDWVIDAINRDLPFDQFTIEQLAGDLLPEATTSQRIATAFLRQTLTNEEGGVDQEEYRVAACFDRTETVGTVWLGLTIGCARCHGHKYDPLPHQDYYKLFAFFNNAEEENDRWPVGAEALAGLDRDRQPLVKAILARKQALAAAEAAWETAERQKLLDTTDTKLSEESLNIVEVTSTALPEEKFEFDAKAIRAPLTPRERDTYTIVGTTTGTITGLKLHALPDDRAPQKGTGLASSGNFVISRITLTLEQDGQPTRDIPLHRATADYSQTGFAPTQVLPDAPDSRKGWAVGGKVGEKHSLVLRTKESVDIPDGAKLRLVIDQQYGSHHVLASFQIAVLRGNARGLGFSDPTLITALDTYPEKRVANIKRQLFDYYVEQVVRDPELAQLDASLKQVDDQHKARLTMVRTISQPLLPRMTRVFHRGEFLSPREEVHASAPQTLTKLIPRGDVPDRLDLARWLVAPENPLTARVAVNHTWQRLFGHGLVRTPADFGVRGERPTHPELLDWLADHFRTDWKWSRKELIRQIVLSAAYRQASIHRPEYEAQDPTNQSLFRQNRFRVEAEIVRDLNLAASGLLSPKIGGPSVFPAMPEELAKLSYANNFTWKNSTGEDRYRRGMYTFFKRTIPHPSLMTFDAPDANVACVERTVSNTPLQSLTLLNNESHLEAAQHMARRALSPPATPDDERLVLALRWCITRSPSAAEVAVLKQSLDSGRDYYRDHEADAKQFGGESAVPDHSFADVAAWTATMRIILNLDEFLTRE